MNTGRNGGLDIEEDGRDDDDTITMGDDDGEELDPNADRGDNLTPPEGDDTTGGDDTAPAGDGKDTTKAGDGTDDDDDAAEIRIPKARFDQVNTRRQMAEARAAQLEEQLQAIRAGKAAPDTDEDPPPQAVDLKALRKQRHEAIMEGDIDKASELEEQIEAEIESRAAAKAMAAYRQEQERATFQSTVAEIKANHPFLDEKSPEANAEAIQEVVELRNLYIQAGKSPADALRDATKKVVRMYGGTAEPKKGDTPPATPNPADERRRGAIQRGADTSNRQPPPTGKAGQGARADTPVAKKLAEMTDEEFEALPEAEQKKLRGDSLDD